MTTHATPDPPRSPAASPSNREFAFIAVMLVLVTGSMIALAAFGMDTLSAVRAYVGGEGLWSKAQKNAVLYLGQYASSGSESDYRHFLVEIAVPLGDRDARLEMEKPEPDPEVVMRGFVAGRNRAVDVPAMARLYRRFHNVDQLARAIVIWREGDEEIARLRRLGEQMLDAVTRRDTMAIKWRREDLDALNRRAGVLEDAFSRTLAEVARWVTGLLLKIMVAVGVLLVIGGIAVSRRMLRQVRASEAALKEIEAAMFRAQKLESLGVLAGGLAHDFNNLLTVILGHSSMLRSDPSLPADLRQSAGEIEVAAGRAAELTVQMLAFAGRGRLVTDTINVNVLVEDIANLLSSAVSKKARIEFALAPEPPTVLGDATQLRQIVMNLITNASEALDNREGVIRLTTGVMDAPRDYLATSYLEEKMEPGRYAVIEVTDDGSGMDETTVRKIFEPFFTTKFSGRGLGLSAVLGIVRKHHGAIWVTSTPGIGTNVRVLLPVAGGDVASHAPPAFVAEANVARTTLLLADDEVAVRRMTQGFLEDAGFQVVAANDGVEAVDAFRQRAGEILAVVLDVTMPRMGGVEACLAIKALRADVPVILTTGYAVEDLMTQFAGDELVSYLAKPFVAEDLVRAVRAATGRVAATPG